MSNIKISEMAEAESLNDNDLLTIVQSGVNKKITKQNAIGNIITALNDPTYVTGTGKSVTLNGTRVGKMKFEYYGDTEQEIIGNLNRFNYTLSILKTRNASGTWSNNVYTNNSVTFTVNEDLTITVNGTASANTYFYLNASNDSYFKTLNGLTLKLTGTPTGGGNETYQMTITSADWSNGTNDNGNGGQFTAIEDFYNNTYIRIANGYNCSNLIFKPMLSTTLTTSYNDYEQPTAGNGKPSPSNLSEVKTVTGENTIDIVGKNFFDIGNSLSTWFQTADNGIKVNYNIVNRTTATINGNKLTVNSYDNTGWTWISKWINLKPNTTYTISGTNTQGIKIVGFNSQEIASTGTLISTKAPNNTFITFNTGNYNYYALSLYPAGADNYIENIQIEIGSTASTYEPYQGQSYELNLGKNLLNPKNIYLGKAWNNADNTARAIAYVPLNVGDTYTISMQNTSAVDMILYNFSSTSVLPYSTAPNAISTTTTITATEKYLYFQFNKTNITTDDILAIKIQIEKGSQATTYEPYFTPIELCNIEEHQEYIYDNGGKWFKHKEVGKIIPTGTETITTRSNTSTTHSKFVIANILPTESAGHFLLRSSHFKVGNANDAAISIDCICSNNTTNYRKYLYFSVNNNIANTTTAFGTWLANNNISVYYVLATPIEEEITEPTLINQLNAIKYGAESYYGETNIIITTENAQPTIEAKAYEKI